MTNKEAAQIVHSVIFMLDKEYYSDAVEEALLMAIKALEQEPCEDCISRKAVTDTTICEGIYCDECSFNTCEDGQSGCLLKERVDKLPSVTPKQKMGLWIFDEILDRHYYCSECKSMGVDYWDFCPFCGAKMEVEE